MENLISQNTGHPERITQLATEKDNQTLEEAAKRICNELSQDIGELIFGFDIRHEPHRTGEYVVDFYLDEKASEEDIKTAKEITADIKKPALRLAS